MAANASALKKGHKSKSKMTWTMGLPICFSKNKNCKEDQYSSQVHPTIPCELSEAWEIARPYRPRLVLNLQTIREEEDASKTPMYGSTTRTPLYFPRGTNTKRFRLRLRRYAKLMWRVHYASRLRRSFTRVLDLFRMRTNPEVSTASGLRVI